MKRILAGFVCAFLGVSADAVVAQGIVVDQGTFTITVAGEEVGTEEFAIRRAGRREDALFANGVVRLRVDADSQVVSPLLQAIPPAGDAAAYQVTVTGPESLELALEKAGRRYVSQIRTPDGEEAREFRAQPDTRVIERDVAHHYYFLRDLREGRSAAALEPRSRRVLELVAGPSVEEEILAGSNRVLARRVEFSDGQDVRIVWYDRQGRVLKVSVPANGYEAVRSDVVG